MKRIDCIKNLVSSNPNVKAKLTINDRGYTIGDLVTLYDYLDYDEETITIHTENTFSED